MTDVTVSWRNGRSQTEIGVKWEACLVVEKRLEKLFWRKFVAFIYLTAGHLVLRMYKKSLLH